MKQIKKEAERIIQLFEDYANYNVVLWDEKNPITDLKENTKQCALICLDEKIRTINEYKDFYGVGVLGVEKLEQVKQYIKDNY